MSSAADVSEILNASSRSVHTCSMARPVSVFQTIFVCNWNDRIFFINQINCHINSSTVVLFVSRSSHCTFGGPIMRCTDIRLAPFSSVSFPDSLGTTAFSAASVRYTLGSFLSNSSVRRQGSGESLLTVSGIVWIISASLCSRSPYRIDNCTFSSFQLSVILGPLQVPFWEELPFWSW